MSEVDRKQLRALAEKATQGEWESDDGTCEVRVRLADYYVPVDVDRRYIAAANPTVVTALLDALDRAEQGEADQHFDVLRLSARVQEEQGNRDYVAKERDACRLMLAEVLASARPNKRDHPCMFAAWERATQLLERGSGSPVGPPGFVHPSHLTTVIETLEGERDAAKEALAGVCALALRFVEQLELNPGDDYGGARVAIENWRRRGLP